MRFAAVLAAAFLLTGCSWVHKELPWTAPAPPPAVPAATPAVPAKPEPAPHPVRPKPRAERPASAAPPPEQTQSEPQAEPVVDYAARCHAMAANRAGDAKELGASPADQAKMQSDTYRDCMAQSK
jgi:hypothetical protein